MWSLLLTHNIYPPVTHLFPRRALNRCRSYCPGSALFAQGPAACSGRVLRGPGATWLCCPGGRGPASTIVEPAQSEGNGELAPWSPCQALGELGPGPALRAHTGLPIAAALLASHIHGVHAPGGASSKTHMVLHIAPACTVQPLACMQHTLRYMHVRVFTHSWATTSCTCDVYAQPHVV